MVNQRLKDGRLGSDEPTALAPPSGVEPASGLQQSRSSTDAAQMIARLRAGLPRGTCGYAITAASIKHPLLDEAADMLAAVTTTADLHWRQALTEAFDAGFLTYLAKGVTSGAFPVRDWGMMRWSDWLIEVVEQHAQAIEARRAATGTGAVEDESAVAASDAPTTSQGPNP